MISTEENIEIVKFAALNLLFKNISGCQLSVGFKAPQYVYGELLTMFEYFNLFKNSVNLLNEQSIFCDLGSGLGKANLVVSACFNIKASIGIEAIPLLIKVSEVHLKIYEEILAPRIQNASKVCFFLGKVESQQENWIHADTIFLNSLTWTTKSIKRIVYLFKDLKINTEVFTSTRLNCPYLHYKDSFKVRMNFSTIEVYLYIKIDTSFLFIINA